MIMRANARLYRKLLRDQGELKIQQVEELVARSFFFSDTFCTKGYILFQKTVPMIRRYMHPCESTRYCQCTNVMKSQHKASSVYKLWNTCKHKKKKKKIYKKR